jgi:DNA-binding IclR family transcriptional regulator
MKAKSGAAEKIDLAVKPETTVKSAMRVFEILRFFERHRRPLRLKDIVGQSGFPTSSTAALLKSMWVQGYLNFDRRTRCYFPTEQLAQLVSWLAVAAYEDDAVRRAMLAIQQRTQEYVALGTPIGIYVEFISALRSSYDLQVWNPPGTKRFLIQSGMGWLLLGQQSKSVIGRIYKQTVESGAIAPQAFSLDALIQQVEKYRRQDYSFTKPSDFVWHPAQAGVGMVAMLVPVPPNHRPLVLGVGGPADRLRANLKSIVTAMRAEIERLDETIASKGKAL